MYIRMSSTRLHNLPCEYKAQESSKKHFAQHISYKYNGEAYDSRIPCLTVINGQMGPELLSYNRADVDSFLKGTYSNNLENPRRDFTPRLKKLNEAKFIEIPDTLIPEPFVVEKCQRLDIFRR